MTKAKGGQEWYKNLDYGFEVGVFQRVYSWLLNKWRLRTGECFKKNMHKYLGKTESTIFGEME
jgi:hypothetical protein